MMILDVVASAGGSGPGEPAETGGAAPSVPLIIDLDGTLLRTDLLWEGLVHLMLRSPRSWLGCFPMALRGPAALKAYVAQETKLDLGAMPFTPEVLALAAAARADGRTVFLASGCHRSHATVASQRFQIPAIVALEAGSGPTGTGKAEGLRARFEQFDYVGNSRTDLPVWRAARIAYVANAPSRVLRSLHSSGCAVRVVSPPLQPWRSLVRALRPHQWAKNLLLFVPAVAAHLPLLSPAWLPLLLGFVSFSLTASIVYLINDLSDISHDRGHPRKRDRPLASGALPLPLALAAIPVLALLVAGTLIVLPPGFAVVLAAYAALSTAYTVALKARLLVDVIALALLYTARVVAGSVLAAVHLSGWFIAFSLFLFFALAVAKRVVELGVMEAQGRSGGTGRAYRPIDVKALIPIGAASTTISCLVFTLYVTSADVATNYATPEILWAGLPVLLYWQARIWVFAVRGDLDDDPIAFAIRDRVSIGAGALLLLFVLLAR